MESPHTPFDEKAALEELERLRDAIEAARRARLAKSDEFEEFVKGFKKPAIELPTPAPVPELLTLTPAPDPPPEAPALTEAIEPQRPIVAPRPVASRRDPVLRVLATLAIAAVALIGGLLYWSRGPATRVVDAPVNEAPSSSAPTPAASAPTSPVQSPPAAQAPPPADAAPTAAVTVELRTLQPVWMRVTVDGQKQREGTVPAGERLQLRGDRAIVIRAGNGGDVVVKNANGEAPLGVAGQPVTFTFTKASGKS